MIDHGEILALHRNLALVAKDVGHELNPVDTVARVWVTGKTSSGKSSFVNDYLGHAVLTTGRRGQLDKGFLTVSKGDPDHNTSTCKYTETTSDSLVIFESSTQVPEMEADLVIYFVDSTAATDPAFLQRFVEVAAPKVLVLGKFDTISVEVEKIMAVADITWSLSTLGLLQQPRTFLYSSVEQEAAWNMRNEIFERVKFATNEKLRKSAGLLAEQTARMIAEIDASMKLNENRKLKAQRIERSTGLLFHGAVAMQSVSVGALLFVGDEVWKFQAVVAALVLSLAIVGVVALLRRFRVEILPGTRTAAVLDQKAELQRISGLLTMHH